MASVIEFVERHILAKRLQRGIQTTPLIERHQLIAATMHDQRRRRRHRFDIDRCNCRSRFGRISAVIRNMPCNVSSRNAPLIPFLFRI